MSTRGQLPDLLGIAVLLLTNAAGCSSSDHSMHKLVDPNPPEVMPIELRVDVALQENDGGRQTTRCQLQIAFEPLPEYTSPGAAAAGLDPEDEPELPQVAQPEEAGTCAFSTMPPVAVQPGTGDPSDPSDPSDDGDNWQLSGAVIGPDFVDVHGLTDTWTLDATDTEHGGIRYEWPDCLVEDFPFSQALTLDVPASDDPDGVHPFEMEDFIAVGPRVLVESPASADGQMALIDPLETLSVSWTLDGRDPRVDGVPQASDVRVKIQSQDRNQVEEVRWLVCWPSKEGVLDISPEQLAPMFEGRLDSAQYSTNIDIHSELLNRDRPTPWGEALTVRTHVSAGAAFSLGEQTPTAPPD